MWQLKKHIPHFESHFVYPYHDNCLKIYKYIKLFSIFSINVLVVTPDSYHYHHPSLQMISKSSNLLLFLKVLSAPYQHINIITVLSLCNHIKLMTKKISLHLTWSNDGAANILRQACKIIWIRTIWWLNHVLNLYK